MLPCRDQHIGIAFFIHGHAGIFQIRAYGIIVISHRKGDTASIGVFRGRYCGCSGYVLLCIRFNRFNIHAGHAGIGSARNAALHIVSQLTVGAAAPEIVGGAIPHAKAKVQIDAAGKLVLIAESIVGKHSTL